MAQAVEVSPPSIGVTQSQVETQPRRFRYGQDAVLTPSNIASASRMAFALPLAAVMVAEGKPNWGIAIAHTVIWMTDKYDGWRAHKDGPTKVGKILDRHSDKVLAWSQLSALAMMGIAPETAVGAMIGRDILVEVNRFVDGRNGIESKSSESHGRAKTLLQAGAIGAAVTPVIAEVPEVVRGSIWLATAASVLSGAIYIAKSVPERRRLRRERKSRQQTPLPA